MILNEFGQIAHDEWLNLSNRFTNFVLDTFQIMPDHMHGIITLRKNREGARLALAPNTKNPSPPNHINPHRDGFSDGTDGFSDFRDGSSDFHDGSSDFHDGQPQGFAPTRADGTNGFPDFHDGQPQGFAPVNTPAVSDIVGAYKSLVANGCLKIYKSRNETMGKLWQRNYYERIIWDERFYQNAKAYIINNPIQWTGDKLHTI